MIRKKKKLNHDITHTLVYGTLFSGPSVLAPLHFQPYIVESVKYKIVE